ncbi:hypothetical protein SPRG_10280 [Saprolegnia parasitica CBS 223.65]|uniref:Peptidase C1A papain C-terminal domain-containing protein n=1 Tax=Saprolegnia parasitica (strain CBS 223.65) TaxID=695850 RepID=A0A067CDY9_SAPPC|nr:hypothetical protein SPRG_10280 [Saprolegnia parasitica CBS 223.65]KDO24746.1 hypothetical protein SPRG_10280 [Saprolegnia parasitica CBS 223.65]|eukprot:XP_012204626.1 hypothetical protein SPRG_10280 [Saprolegnia parasitica CBS 223.65]
MRFLCLVALLLSVPLGALTLSADERDELSRDLARWQTKFGNDDHVAKDKLPALQAANPYATFSHLTKFALLSDNEFSQFASSPSPSPSLLPAALPAAATLNRSAVGGTGVDTVDWTTQSTCVTPVKWMGKCRSDWAIAAAAAVSSAHCLATSQFIDLSVQQVLSCTYSSGLDSCWGPGTPFDGMQWLLERSSALCTEKANPYTSGHSGVTPKCSDNTKCTRSISLYVGEIERARGEAALEEQLRTQPVVAFATTNNYAWRLYTGGLLSWCPGGRLDQAVLVVGYGTEDVGYALPPVGFFKVRSAWGTDWGEHGDVRLARGPGTGDFGTCDIATHLVYPQRLPFRTKASDVASTTAPHRPTPPASSRMSTASDDES